MKDKIKVILINDGIPSNLKGFSYLVEVIYDTETFYNISSNKIKFWYILLHIEHALKFSKTILKSLKIKSYEYYISYCKTQLYINV